MSVTRVNKSDLINKKILEIRLHIKNPYTDGDAMLLHAVDNNNNHFLYKIYKDVNWSEECLINDENDIENLINETITNIIIEEDTCTDENDDYTSDVNIIFITDNTHSYIKFLCCDYDYADDNGCIGIYKREVDINYKLNEGEDNKVCR